MKIVINSEGKVVAVGSIYQTEAPSFIEADPFNWVYDGDGDLYDEMNWTYSPPPATYESKLLARREFGEKIVNDFLASRLANPTNLSEDAALSSVLMPIALSLQLGSLGLALAQIMQLEAMAGLDMDFVGDKITEIQNYLANESN